MMSDERRYSAGEIEKIFSEASRREDSLEHSKHVREGLTLRELQEIGSEVGIAPESVARAAAAVDYDVVPTASTTYLGVPVTVGRTVHLPSPMSDADWDRLVVDLRETFRASGEVRIDGALRQWRNGNLKTLIEPAESGSRLRLQSLHEIARSQLVGGLAFFVMMLGFITVMIVSGQFGANPQTFMLSLLAAGGLGTMGIAAYRLPRWVKRRAEQMEGVASRALERSRRTADGADNLPISPALASGTSEDLLRDTHESKQNSVIQPRPRERN